MFVGVGVSPQANLFGGVPLPPEPEQFIINGSGATDTDWTKGAGITISGGVFTWPEGSVSSLSQTMEAAVRAGNSYDVSIAVLDNPSETTVRVTIGAQVVRNAITASVDTITFTFIASAATDQFQIRMPDGDEALGLVLDDISLVPTP